MVFAARPQPVVVRAGTERLFAMEAFHGQLPESWKLCTQPVVVFASPYDRLWCRLPETALTATRCGLDVAPYCWLWYKASMVDRARVSRGWAGDRCVKPQAVVPGTRDTTASSGAPAIRYLNRS